MPGDFSSSNVKEEEKESLKMREWDGSQRQASKKCR